jgi:branched-chain amino acid transport system substrate-binding protein
MVGSWAKICAGQTRRAAAAALAAAAAMLLSLHTPAYAAEPIKVGFSMAMTGGVAQNGKQLLIALQLWRDDVNAKGGLLGRPVELVYYDDQSNPSNVPGIYTKLINSIRSISFSVPTPPTWSPRRCR